MYFRYLLMLFFLLFSTVTWSQTSKDKKKQSATNIAADELSKSLSSNSSDESVAKDYERLATEFAANGDYVKAEDYFNRAKKLYEKLKDKEKIAATDREIAKMQEAQNKLGEAIASYNMAGMVAPSAMQQAVNKNDANRLMNQANPKVRSEYIQKNIELLEKSDNRDEKVVAYQQMAEAYMDMDNTTEAISNLKDALKEVKDKPNEAIKINRKLAEVYVAERDFDKAIHINKVLIAEAKKTNDTKVEVEQLQSLSSTYFEGNEPDKGLTLLQDAYALSVNKGHTMEAKKSLELLVEQYRKENKSKMALEAYADFVMRLDTLMKKDTTLIDAGVLQMQEDKITQLENERALQNELIEKKNTFNTVLIGSVILVFIFLLLIARAFYAIKKKNKEIALQSLRREMNPHFIFNSLNSVNQFIAENNELEANKYLSSYSKLMRNIMENSNKDFISLSTEIEQLQKYLDLEHMRFHDKFTYTIDIDPSLDTDAIFVPNMLIQPQLENAIWHGLRYKAENGILLLVIKQEGNVLHVIIEDNGIGLKKSKELKTKHQKEHKSRGVTNTHERINLLNELYNCKITVNISEKEASDNTGVIVVFHFPIMNKNR